MGNGLQLRYLTFCWHVAFGIWTLQLYHLAWKHRSQLKTLYLSVFSLKVDIGFVYLTCIPVVVTHCFLKDQLLKQLKENVPKDALSFFQHNMSAMV